MASYFITRHEGAAEWARKHRPGVVVCKHLDDLTIIKPGDEICGTLPINLAADVILAGARFFHLEVPMPLELRGRELSAEQMEKLEASLVEYVIERK